MSRHTELEMNLPVGNLADLGIAAQAPTVATAPAPGLPSTSSGGAGGHGQQQPAGPASASDTALHAANGSGSGASTGLHFKGCDMCRKLKRRCERRRENITGPCERCFTSSYECSLVLGQSTPVKIQRVIPTKERTEAGTPRKRAQQACVRCNKQKTKCSGDSPRCKRCKDNNFPCMYTRGKRRFSHPLVHLLEPRGESHEVVAGPSSGVVKDNSTPPASRPSPKPFGFAISPATMAQTRQSTVGHLYNEDGLARKQTLHVHFQVFFSFWAPMPCMGIMLPDTTYAEIDDGKLHPIVGAVVCAMTSRIICPGQKHILFAEKCAGHVDSYLIRTMNSFLGKTTYQTLTIIVCAIRHFWNENQMSKVWMYMSLAARLVTALQLNSDVTGDSLLSQEMNRRLVWACYILDRSLAGGFDEHVVLRDNYMRLELPVSNEVLYEAARITEVGGQGITPFRPNRKPCDFKKQCLDVCHLRLHRLRHKILGFTRLLTRPTLLQPHGQQIEASEVVMTQVDYLQKQLDDFQSELPEELTLTDANINHFLSSTEGPSFMIMHTLLWILHVDLYSFTIPGIRDEASPELKNKLPVEHIYKYQQQAVGYAVRLARFWRYLQGIVAQRPSGNGAEKLLTVDQMFATYVSRLTKVLLAVRQRRLFENLEYDNTPLVHQEPVDDAALAALVQSNMQLIPPLAWFFPHVSELTQDLRHAVDNFSHGTRNDDVGTGERGTPAAWPPEEFRLPHPLEVLEQASRPQEADKDDWYMENPREMSTADRLIEYKTMSVEQSPMLTTPLLAWLPGEAAVIPLDVSATEIPFWLAEARSCDPRLKPPQQCSSSNAHAQASSSTRSGDASSMSPPPWQTSSHITMDSLLPSPPLLSERAGGDDITAPVPTTRAEKGKAVDNRRNYNGASDPSISYVRSQQLDFE